MEEKIKTPVNIIDANPEQFYKSVHSLREKYNVIEEHIGCNVIATGVANGQIQTQVVHYCTAFVEMSKAEFISMQAREKLKV